MPSLIHSIKIAGLVLVTDTFLDSEHEESTTSENNALEGIDGFLRSDGILEFNEVVDM